MVQYECTEKHTVGCEFKTQDLPSEQANIILKKHLKHVHKSAQTDFDTSVKFPKSNGSQVESFYVCLEIEKFPAKVPGSRVYQALTDAGCPGYISTVDDETGHYDGAVIIKLLNEEDKANVLNYDYKSLFHVEVKAEEVDEALFFKFATKFERDELGNNVFIRLKGMEWTTSEDQIRDAFKKKLHMEGHCPNLILPPPPLQK